jgi:hypothetical protein
VRIDLMTILVISIVKPNRANAANPDKPSTDTNKAMSLLQSINKLSLRLI